MKRISITILVIILLSSFRADIDGPWIKTENLKITLYTRPENYSKTTSPDNLTINKILDEQKNVIHYINERLKTSFSAKVEIYLFNLDEAKEKIGTNGGGFCSSKNNKIFYTFYNKTFYNTIRCEPEYIGVHEMVHLIAREEIGSPKTRFFAEGYSNAIDGNYGSQKKDANFIRLRNDSTVQKLIGQVTLYSPSELLYDDKIPENEYYPQIGCLFTWLFEEYGVEKINKLYTCKRAQVEKKFKLVTGDAFKDMEAKYKIHIQN